MRFTHKFFQPGYWNVNGSPRRFTRKELSEYCNNTQAFIDANQDGGVPIFPVHASPGTPEGGPQLSKQDARDNVGWVEGMRINSAGECFADYDVADERTAKCIDNGTIKFTSPEFGAVDHVDSNGKSWGKMFRHMATTATPRNREQGPITSLQCAEDCFQFSEDDFMGKTKKEADDKAKTDTQFAEDEARKKLEELSEAPTSEPPAKEEAEPVAENPESEPEVPPKNETEVEVEDGSDNSEDAEVNAMIVRLVELTGIELPPMASRKEVLTAIINREVTKQEADAAMKGDLPGVTEEAPIAQFSEEQQALWDTQNTELVALRAEKAAGRMAVKRAGMEATIRSARAPKKMKDRLIGMLGAVQFSEDGEGAEEPMFTMQNVLALVHDSLPKSMQFGETDIAEAAHPEGDKFFKEGDSTDESDAEADKAVDEQLANAGMGGEGGFSGDSTEYRRSFGEQPAAV